TKDLLFENEQVPASASLADTLNKEPEHISSKDPEELIRKFREDSFFLPEQQQKLISQWCFQNPVRCFNSERYNLNLIKKYFVTHIAQSGDVKVANKTRKNNFPLSLKEYEDCQRVFRERGMKTLADWLHFYNNLAVEPFLDALESTRDFYTGLGI
ncbi:unnamed protein product, partial [Porites lobata]